MNTNTTKPMIAYHGKVATKRKYLARIREHRRLDHLTQGVGWEQNGKTKGCAVGCTLETYDHSRYPIELGISEELAHLEDSIFEGLPRKDALAWPEAFLSAIKPGADLSMVIPQFLLWLLADEKEGVIRFVLAPEHKQQKDAIEGVAVLYREWIDTGVKPSHDRFRAARSAEWSAEIAAWSAEWSAASAARAAWSAESAARSAANAARSAANAAWSAEWSAASAARSAAWKSMSQKLLSLLKAAPVVR